MILNVQSVTKSFGGLHALSDITFEVGRGQIYSIIGPNGAGKTTALNILSGAYRPTTGRIGFDGQDVSGWTPHRLAQCGISRTFQNLQIFLNATAHGNVLNGRHRFSEKRLSRILLRPPSMRLREAAEARRAAELLDFVGLDGIDNETADSLSYGVLKRLEIARALAAEPKLLLLDEPAAGCNPKETDQISDLIGRIAKSGVTVILVEHDMKLVMSISNRILVLNHGRVLAEGTVSAVRNNKDVIRAYLGEPEMA